ncbi:MAG: hypothetical protein AB4290_05695 [Spirulina sp.]
MPIKILGVLKIRGASISIHETASDANRADKFRRSLSPKLPIAENIPRTEIVSARLERSIGTITLANSK